MARGWLFGPLTLLLGGILSLVAAEALLRATGNEPWSDKAADRQEPAMQVPDARLGWRNKPGHYRLPAFGPGGSPTEVTLREDGSRSTGGSAPPDAPSIVFVGGSITQGFAISDDQTFAWKLQQEFPQIRIINRGAAAYGSVQTLAILEEVLAGPDLPREIFYPFVQHHETRNVAHPNWLRMLSVHSRRGHVATPYATLDAFGNLELHAPMQYPAWPGHAQLASVAFAESAWATFRARDRVRITTQVTEKLIEAMGRAASRAGVGFHVVLIQATDRGRSHYTRFLRRHRIDVVDCMVPIENDMRVPGEGHPNEKANAIWARCIAERVRALPWLAAAQSAESR